MKDDRGFLAHDLVLTPVPHDGPGQVFQTNAWDILREVTEPTELVDCLIGAKTNT